MLPEDRESYEGEPCTCSDDCSADCKGECGCEAHRLMYQDFLSQE